MIRSYDIEKYQQWKLISDPCLVGMANLCWHHCPNCDFTRTVAIYIYIL